MSQTARHLREKEPVIERSYEPRHVQQELPQRRITVGEKVIWSAGFLVVLVLAVFIVSNQAQLFKNSRDIGQLQQKMDKQEKVNQQLNVQVTELSAPERIISFAKNKLGLNLNVKNVKVLP